MFPGDLARAIDAELRTRFPALVPDGHGPYESEPVDAYQAVYIPGAAGVDHVAVATLADPLQIGSLPSLLDELHRFALAAMLPTDDVELMKLAVYYLETDFDADLDIQTYVQLMLSARQAGVRGQALWVVV